MNKPTYPNIITDNSIDSRITSLEALVANTCFCKLKNVCPDKTSLECMKHRNIYQEFNQSRTSA